MPVVNAQGHLPNGFPPTVQAFNDMTVAEIDALLLFYGQVAQGNRTAKQNVLRLCVGDNRP